VYVDFEKSVRKMFGQISLQKVVDFFWDKHGGETEPGLKYLLL